MSSFESMSTESDSSESVEMVEIVRGQEKWYGSNKSERIEMINIIGAFAARFPLKCYVRKDGKIGRIKVSNGLREKTLRKDMWYETGDRIVHHPDQYIAATNIRTKIWTIERQLRMMRAEFNRERYFQTNVHDPIVDNNGIHDRLADLQYLVRKLTKSDPNNYKLRVYWR